MKNNKLQVFQELGKQIENSLFDTKAQRFLSVMVKVELEELDRNSIEPTIFNRKRLLHLAEGISYAEAENKSKQQTINEIQLNNAIKRLINSKQENQQIFIKLGYFPVVKTNQVEKGGRGYEKEFWLDIEENQSNLVENEHLEEFEGKSNLPKVYAIDYERTHISDIKISWFSKIFLNDGELRMKSIIGYALMFFFITLFFSLMALAVLTGIAIIFMPQQKKLTLMGAFIVLSLPIMLYTIFKEIIQPLNKLTINRVAKVPEFLFLSLTENEADFEMYRKDGSSYARLTRFVATCPICTAPIWLAEGKPDQKAPLIGRCREAPHAHVYSFDRVTLKGYFLGHEGYLKESNSTN